MVDPVSLSIRDLRDKAAEHRRLANEIDSRIDALLEVIGMDPSDFTDSKKVKQPGIVTNKWQSTLLRLAAEVQRRPFDAGKVMDAAKETTGRIMRVADVRRQFEPYLAAGYFVQPGRDLYQFTDEGLAKIGFTPDSDLDFPPPPPRVQVPLPPRQPLAPAPPLPSHGPAVPAPPPLAQSWPPAPPQVPAPPQPGWGHADSKN